VEEVKMTEVPEGTAAAKPRRSKAERNKVQEDKPEEKPVE